MIYLDSCLLIYAVERDPTFGAKVMESMASAEEPIAISSLVKLECLVKPLRAGDLVLQRYYEAAFEQLLLLPVDDETCLAAARLRAQFDLRTPDALHLACAQRHSCSALWTNDDRLARAALGLARNVVRTRSKR